MQPQPVSNQNPFFSFLVLVRDKCLLKNVDYINEVLNETVDDDEKQNLPDDWEEGLTFTARSSRKYNLEYLSYFVCEAIGCVCYILSSLNYFQILLS